MTRSAWLDPGNIRSAVGLALIAAVANAIWIFLDNSTPSYDQSSYMSIAIVFRDALQHGGPSELLKAIWNTDPARGPLFTVAILPFISIFGDGARSGMLVNIALAPVLYLAAGQIAWIVFRNGTARLLAILFVTTMPLLVGLQHEVLQDFLLVTMVTVAVLLLLQTEGFSRRWFCVGLGIAMGLGTLTKVTFPAFMLGPVVVVLAQIAYAHVSAGRMGAARADLRAVAVNAGLALLVYLVIVAPWYVTNFHPTLEYIRSTTSGPLSEGAGPEHPLTFDAIASFTTGVLNEHVSWILGLTFLAALAFDLRALGRLFRPVLRVEPLLRIALVAVWALIPYLIVATAHNQDVRLMAAAMPAVAVIAAGAVAAIPQRQVRIGIVAIAAVALVFQTASRVVRINPPLLSDEAKIELGGYSAFIRLDSGPMGYERLPEADIAGPILRYIEETAAAEPGRTADRNLCVLESEPFVNTNTFYYLVTSRGDPYNVVAEQVGPTGRAGLAANLHECDFALFMKQSSAATNPSSRVAIVNNEYAARFMTPALFRIFRGRQRVFRANPDYLTDRAPSVRVLTLNPAR